MKMPDPQAYSINENQTKLRKWEDRSFGSDVRSNQKMIAMTPGPGEYIHVD